MLWAIFLTSRRFTLIFLAYSVERWNWLLKLLASLNCIDTLHKWLVKLNQGGCLYFRKNWRRRSIQPRVKICSYTWTRWTSGAPTSSTSLTSWSWARSRRRDFQTKAKFGFILKGRYFLWIKDISWPKQILAFRA